MTIDINQETRLPYLRHDYLGTRVRQAQFRGGRDWRVKYIQLLKRREYEKAEELREQVTRMLRELR